MSETMQAGRDLDAAIALEVMGWEIRKRGRRVWRGDVSREIAGMGSAADARSYIKAVCPEYSTRIAEAWRVVERLVPSEKSHFQLDTLGFDGEMWRCCFAADVNSDQRDFHMADADTAPLAICLAARKAVGA